ncbi:hypothetical protein [Rhodococcus globerulus]|uniref:Uncharacterized protein n=1 Tax=Rhodococcus globerulus TaxID=33008 RepID=A0ABU4C2D0_RHOGO|nr:hypothetical protein [Rhodococcus globerulus]MDV6270661.1 hypothetical protein [Rhodococcus globerulus]
MTLRVGLVVAGAGARGAYEAGALSEQLLPRMEAHGPRPPCWWVLVLARSMSPFSPTEARRKRPNGMEFGGTA